MKQKIKKVINNWFKGKNTFKNNELNYLLFESEYENIIGLSLIYPNTLITNEWSYPQVQFILLNEHETRICIIESKNNSPSFETIYQNSNLNDDQIENLIIMFEEKCKELNIEV